MKDPIATAAEDIRSMKVRGAGLIARTASAALSDFAKTYRGNSIQDFREKLRDAEEKLLASRPTAISLYNGVAITVEGVDECGSVAAAVERIMTNSAKFIEDSANASKKIAAMGAKRICDGDTVLTHCNSSLAVGVIAEAVRQGKGIRVFATESRPWGQGYITVTQLAEAGADTTLIIDSAVNSVIKKVDRVFVGADTITSSGDLVNKIGTSQIALCARDARAEFNVCAESFKFSPKTLDGETVIIEERDPTEVLGDHKIPKSVWVYNPVFDITPARYIDNVICEFGVMSPGSVYGVLRRRHGRD